ncbi:hypothetical protein SV7mr_23840 [Stieleria bergensis]|uniref:Caspase domain protein n=1 Tax=Stieleria bergensis TaxID=2528025 RepID=A0A517SUS3_9BACT|nr:hypothetical protein SV7mr_23840 [Planctomycetes bacterium SV_7m_r]
MIPRNIQNLIWTASLSFFIGHLVCDAQEPAQTKTVDMILVQGADGAAEYGEQFTQWSSQWTAVCQAAGLELKSIGPETNANRTALAQLQQAISEALSSTESKPLWLVLIGHGIWDGKSADFNLVGPDLHARTLKQWLAKHRRPIIIVNGSASSGPFVNRLSGPNRVIVTATQSGTEYNFARFAGFMAQAFLDGADIDHDDAVSVREAFLAASALTQQSYEEQGRLPTEHSLLDDNGDQRGSRAELIQGTATSKNPKQAIDGQFAARFAISTNPNAIKLNAEQVFKRDELETQLMDVQKLYAEDPDKLKHAALPILLQLSELYQQAKDQATSNVETEEQGSVIEQAATEKDAIAKENSAAEEPPQASSK